MVRRVFIAVLCLSSWCLVVTIVLPLTLMMPCVGLQCVIVVYPVHVHFLLVFLLHIIAMVSPFQAVGNTNQSLSYSVFFLLFLGLKFGPIPLAKKYGFFPYFERKFPSK